MNQEFEAVIGLEVHCQLSTETKIFCGCKARVSDATATGELTLGDRALGATPCNANTCPICAGHPGTLPVLNKKAVEFAVKAGLATGCEIRRNNVFARKNYFYPDLPKGYQISQFDMPICEEGSLTIELEGGAQKRIGIQRIHLEEDAGKSVHHDDYSVVNLNRAGTPLVEIVSHPQLKTSAEAGAYLRGLHAIVTAIGISDGNMQNGNFRCDANVSVMPKGSDKFGTRAEIKNVNSFKFVEKAIDYEIARQIEVIRSGGKVVQETRLYDSDKNVTISMRSKEEAQDYRYFPDPDLISVQISEALIAKIKAEMPELPSQKKARYESELGLSSYDAGVLTASSSLAEYFDRAVKLLVDRKIEQKTAAKQCANILAGEVARLINDEGIELPASKLKPEHVADVVALFLNQEISSGVAKKLIGFAWSDGGVIATIVAEKGLKQVSDTSALEPIIDQVINENPAQVAEYKAGKEKVFGFFVGQVMRRSGGKANPATLQELIKKRLSS